MIRDWSGDAVRKHATDNQCCADGAWRGKFCPYHQGMEDGMDSVGNMLLDDEINPADLGMVRDGTAPNHQTALWRVPS